MDEAFGRKRESQSNMTCNSCLAIDSHLWLVIFLWLAHHWMMLFALSFLSLTSSMTRHENPPPSLRKVNKFSLHFLWFFFCGPKKVTAQRRVRGESNLDAITGTYWRRSTFSLPPANLHEEGAGGGGGGFESRCCCERGISLQPSQHPLSPPRRTTPFSCATTLCTRLIYIYFLGLPAPRKAWHLARRYPQSQNLCSPSIFPAAKSESSRR